MEERREEEREKERNRKKEGKRKREKGSERNKENKTRSIVLLFLYVPMGGHKNMIDYWY